MFINHNFRKKIFTFLCRIPLNLTFYSTKVDSSPQNHLFSSQNLEEIRKIGPIFAKNFPENLQNIKENLLVLLKNNLDLDFLSEISDFSQYTGILFPEISQYIQNLYSKEKFEFPIDFWINFSDFLNYSQQIELFNSLDLKNPHIFSVKTLNFLGINSRLFYKGAHIIPSIEFILSNYIKYLRNLEKKDKDYEKNNNESYLIKLGILRSVSIMIVFDRSLNQNFAKKTEFLHEILIKTYNRENLSQIRNKWLVQISAGYDRILSKNPDNLEITKIHEELLQETLRRMQEGIFAKEPDLGYLIEAFIMSHDHESKSLILKDDPKENLIPLHRQFLETYYKLFLGKLKGLKPPKIILIQIPKLMKLGRLIGYEDKGFYEYMESAIFVFQNYKEKELFIKTFVLTGDEVIKLKNKDNSFYKFKKKIFDILELILKEFAQNPTNPIYHDILIKTLNLAKYNGYTIKQELVNLIFEQALEFSFNNGIKMQFFLEIFRFYINQLITKNTPQLQTQKWIYHILFGISKLESYHYIYEFLSFISYKNDLLLPLEDVSSMQNLFHCFAVLQMNYTEIVERQSLHNKLAFIKNLKNFLIKFKYFFSDAKKVKFISFTEYLEIFRLSKETILKNKNKKFTAQAQNNIVFFPLLDEIMIKELKDLLYQLQNREKNFNEKELLDQLTYMGTLRFILTFSKSYDNNDLKIHNFYNNFLLESDTDVKLYRYYQILSSDYLFKSTLDGTNPLLIELKNHLEEQFSIIATNKTNPKISKVLFLLKLLDDNKLKDPNLWKNIASAYEGREGFQGFDYLKFNSFDFLENQKKTSIQTIKQAFEKMDSNKIIASNAYTTLMSTPIGVLDNETLFLLEKTLARELQTLSMKKLANIAQKFEQKYYQALKFGPPLKKYFISKVFCEGKFELVENSNYLGKIAGYLLENELMTNDELFNEITKDSNQYLKNSPELMIDLLSRMFEVKKDEIWENLNPFYQNFLWDLLKNADLQISEIGKLMLYGILSSMDDKRLMNEVSVDFIDFQGIESKKALVLKKLYRIPKIFLNTDYLSEYKIKILEFLIKTFLKENEYNEFIYKFLVELEPLKRMRPELFNMAFELVFNQQEQRVKEIDLLTNEKIIINYFCMIYDIEKIKDKIGFSLMKKVKTLAENKFTKKELQKLLDCFKNRMLLKYELSFLNFLEISYFMNNKRDYYGLLEVYLIFVRNNMASDFFMENVERQLMSNNFFNGLVFGKEIE